MRMVRMMRMVKMVMMTRMGMVRMMRMLRMVRMTRMVIKVGIGKAAVLTSPAVDGRTLCHRRTCTSKL